MTPNSLQKIQRSNRIRIEVIEGNRRRPVVGWLRRGVHQNIRLDLLDQLQNSLAIADIDFVMDKAL